MQKLQQIFEECHKKDSGYRPAQELARFYFANRDMSRRYRGEFISVYLDSSNASATRESAKVVYDMLRRNMTDFTADELERIVERAFTLLTDDRTKAAVKVFSSRILFALKEGFDWVGENLEAILTIQLQNEPTPGLANSASKILRKLRP